MHGFDYVAPTEAGEVLDLLAESAGEAILIGGGTATVLMMKQDLLAPARVIGLGRIASLREIGAAPGGGLRLGATCTVTDLIRLPAVAAAYPVIADAARQVANVRIRNVATLGGNLVHADPAQDLPPVLMALGATATLQSREGCRQVPLDQFYLDYMMTAVQPDELVTEVQLPAPPAGLRAAYIKFTPRSRDDYATVGVACAVTLQHGQCRTAAIVLGGVGATPVRARSAEEVLQGSELTAGRIAEAAALVREAVEPWDDLRGSAEYKREMSRVWTERALAQLSGNAGKAL